MQSELINMRQHQTVEAAALGTHRAIGVGVYCCVTMALTGEAMLAMLNGIFAFAIYDQADQTLFLACDAMGVKPLYFSVALSPNPSPASGRGGVVFASELKALLACGGVTGSLDVAALFRTLGFLWSPGVPRRSRGFVGWGRARRCG